MRRSCSQNVVNIFKILSDKPIGKIHLGRPKHRWEDIIRMDFIEIGVSTRIQIGIV